MCQSQNSSNCKIEGYYNSKEKMFGMLFKHDNKVDKFLC
mgnify:FL=1